MSGAFAALIGFGTLALIYAIWAMALNYEAGWGGLWDLGLVGIIAVGAYTYVILVEPVGIGEEDLLLAPELPIWVGVLAAGVVGGLVALLIGLPALRLRGEYFLITTFAFAELVIQLADTQTALTRGVVGFISVKRPFADVVEPANYNYLLFGMTAGAAIVVYLLFRRLGKSPHVRALRALRDNEAAGLSIGKHASAYRLRTFVFAGALLAASAPLYVWYIRSVFPSMFSPTVTFTIWVAIAIGGLGSFQGPVAGAILFTAVTEGLLYLPVPADYATQLSGMSPFLIGLTLIVVIRFRPAGLFTERNALKRITGGLPHGRPTRRMTGPMQDEMATAGSDRG